ncbi:hypothetical protein RB595_010130 [Gaeumannomyces hyphopodioides]
MLTSDLFNDTHAVPIRITNSCPDTIWPAVATQHGRGPGLGGFELGGGKTRDFNVSFDWQGRIWGRTNCTFNANGTGPADPIKGSAAGPGTACATGDCFGVRDCTGGGQVPSTLAEFTLQGGVGGKQTFYDISLVDGYNLPVGIVYIPAPNTTFIPPNLVNPSCIATGGWLAPPSRIGGTYTNRSYPMPYEPRQDNAAVRRWCPWPLQRFPPEKPGDGVYPYPDDGVERPPFNPCMSACVATNSDEDCCRGSHNDPNVCRGGLYAANAKRVCPDAYSFAYDDQTSTFIIPSGGGWEVVFCPAGRSTNILSTFGTQMQHLAASGNLTRQMLEDVASEDYIRSHTSAAVRGDRVSLKALISFTLGLGLLTALW